MKEGLTPDDVLDNVTLFWLTNTAVSAARLYRENKLAFFQPRGVKIPVAASAFPTEMYQAPRSWAEQAYPKLLHDNKPLKGGHFAAWEQPQLLSEEMRAGFKSVRQLATKRNSPWLPVAGGPTRRHRAASATWRGRMR